MKTTVKFSVWPHKVPRTVFDQLLRAYPEGNRGKWFEVSLDEQDDRLRIIWDTMHRLGYAPCRDNRRRQPGFLWVDMIRTYGQSDFDQADYLVAMPTHPIGEVSERNHTGLKRLSGRGLDGASDIGFDVGITLVTDRLKQAMEQSSLRHLLFKATVLIDVPARSGVTPFWELTSDVVLPPLSPSCTIMNNDGQPFDGDLTKGCFLVEGLYSNPEYHYRANELRAVEPFDLALTREQFGNAPGAAWPGMICSKRFYDFCRERNLPMNWQPVRIDPE